MAAGGLHSLTVKADGTVWAWGSNYYGQLGDGTTTLQTSPVQVPGLTGVTAVAAGYQHNLVFKSDGTVWAWGNNYYGQLGDGTTTLRTSPVQVPGLTGVTAVAAGAGHSLAVKSDGTVWAWGANDRGQLGDGTTTRRTSPVQVPDLTGVVAVAAGNSHSLAVKADGTVWAWGGNTYGQLGDETTMQRTSPMQVLRLTAATAVAAGDGHSLLRKSDGTVWAWGYNSSGQLGDGTRMDRHGPVQVPSLTGVTAVTAGSGHSLAIKADGTAWAWGNNFSGQLGDGTTTLRTSPVKVPDLATVAAMAAGGSAYSGSHSLAVANDGTVWAWGYNYYGQLGDGTTTQEASPVQISSLSDAAVPPSITTQPAPQIVELDQAGVFSVSATGTPVPSYQWRRNGMSIVDDNRIYGATTAALTVSHACTADIGFYDVVIRNTFGTVTSCPVNLSIPGFPPPMITTQPVGQVLQLGRQATFSVAASSMEVITYQWRKNGLILGDNGHIAGATTSTLTINDVTATDIGRYDVVVSNVFGAVISSPARLGTLGLAYAAGDSHSLAIKSNGSVWAWGNNTYGQLGDGTSTKRISPVQVPGLTGVVAVEAGGQHSLAVKSDGTVWAWGWNSYGQLGDGTATDRRSCPVQVRNLTGVVAVAAGYWQGLAVKDDGTVWAWGGNGYGQLGDGTTTQRNCPVQVLGLTDVVAVAASKTYVAFSLAVRRDGTVWAWGGNSNGQLGDGTTTQRTSPVQVSGLSGAVAVTAGNSHSLAVRDDGTVWAWGRNDYGQLGDGTTTGRSRPVQVPNLTGVAAVAAGYVNSLFVPSVAQPATPLTAKTWPADSTLERHAHSIVVSFDRPVLNVSADDLILSAGTVLNVEGSGNGGYVFTVTGLPPGTTTATIGGDITSEDGVVLSPYQWTFRVAKSSDINGDGHVDVTDLLRLAGSWGKASGQVGFDPACDLNSDGRVNVVDLLILADNWGM